jgi:hypothetical protein
VVVVVSAVAVAVAVAVVVVIISPMMKVFIEPILLMDISH